MSDDLWRSEVDWQVQDGVLLPAGIPVCWMLRPSNDVNVACIYETENGWRVSTTDERGTEQSIREYGDRDAAIEDFLSRVDGFVRYQELRKRLQGQR